MNDLIDCEARLQRHAQKTAAVDREGWKQPQRTRQSVRSVVAKALLTLAARIAPPSEAGAPATTLAKMHRT